MVELISNSIRLNYIMKETETVLLFFRKVSLIKSVAAMNPSARLPTLAWTTQHLVVHMRNTRYRCALALILTLVGRLAY